MKIYDYNRDSAQQAFDKWLKDKETIGLFDSLDEDYKLIRNELQKFYKKACEESKNDIRKDYCKDVSFGIYLYEYFSKQTWFNMRVASNDGFWRYLSVNVIPDIVADRWGEANVNYFWKQSNRLWPKSIWWFIHLSYHDSLSSTRNILLGKNFNSDIIQGLVERTGKKGSVVEVYREIILQYSLLNYNTIIKFKKEKATGSNDNLFRAIMRINTAKSLVYDPCLCPNGVEGYVSSIIANLNP